VARLRNRLRSLQNDTAKTLRDLDLLRMASENASDGLLIQDIAGRIVWCNDTYCCDLGMPREDILGRNPLEFAVPSDQHPSQSDFSTFRYDPHDETLKDLQLYQNQRPDGTRFWTQIGTSIRKGTDGQTYAVLVCRDVTQQVEKEKNLEDLTSKLEYEATHDSLTGLPNRSAFLSFVEHALDQDPKGSVGLLHIDLDNFKTINDTHGHSAGDAVLRHAANTISENLRDTDMVARIGGDEFVVVCRNVPDLCYLNGVSQRLLDQLCRPFAWSDRSLIAQASIGAAQTIDETQDADELLIQADFALYEAKKAGRARVALYDENLHQRYTAETCLAGELAQAIDTGTMDFWFQPIKNMRTGQIFGFETLVRWTHPETQRIYTPDEFLPIVDDLGFLAQLDMISMMTALDKKSALDASGHCDLRISFNASPELLSHPDFINRLIWAIEANNISRNQITIEVLETTNFGNLSETSSQAAIIRDLKLAGFNVFLDDFGVGFAGLSHLAALDVSGVKIDRSLITGLLHDDVSFKVVRKTIELCIDLDIDVVAEGVEDPATAHALHAMGCKLIQGFWLSKPIKSSDMLPWLDAQRVPHKAIS